LSTNVGGIRYETYKATLKTIPGQLRPDTQRHSAVSWRDANIARSNTWINFCTAASLAFIVPSLFMHALSQPSIVTAFKYVYGWSNSPWRWWINYWFSVGNSELGAGVSIVLRAKALMLAFTELADCRSI